ncbi:hypothetical protein [Cardinium endosymbiont of Philonthus spinipes]|uniref:hypothetical protein n=1 Tax=Cardinium endosymbiont of Philonthus spinipes TaxID=3077941 RepID=UPI00313B0F78
MHKHISDFVTDSHDILNSTEDEDVKIEFIYDIYKMLYQQIHGPDAEPNMDINLYKKEPKELLETIEKLEQTRWLKQLDVLVNYINTFSTRSQYVLNLKVHNSSFIEQEQEYIKKFMNWLSLFHITLIRDWIPNISTETEPNTESNYPNSLQILEELPPSY